MVFPGNAHASVFDSENNSTFLGLKPNIDYLKGILPLDDAGLIITNAKIKEIAPQEIKYVDAEGNEQTVAADTVILATDREPNRELHDALIGKVSEFHEIGDCWRPGTIGSAVHDANHWARQI